MIDGMKPSQRKVAHACVARKLYAPKEMKATSAIITYDLGDYQSSSRRLSIIISAVITGGVPRWHGLDYDLIPPR